MLDEENKKPRGILEHNPLLIFIWAAIPIVFLFGITISSIGEVDNSTSDEMSLYVLGAAQFISIIILLVLPALILAFLYKRDVLTFFNLRKAPSLKMVAYTIAIILVSNTFLGLLTDINALIPLPEILANKFKLMHEAALAGQERFLGFNNIPEFILVFVIIAILPAITEEMYFRGLLERTLFDAKMAPIHAIFISSFLFALIHFEFYYLLPLLFMGLTLGYIYYRTKNLWLSIIAHFFNNGLIVLVTGSNKLNLTNIDVEGNPSIYISIVGINLFIIIIYFFHKQTTNTKF